MAITDAPNLRAAENNKCCNCAFFKFIADGDGMCTKFETAMEAEYVCDAWEAMPAPEPTPVIVIEQPEMDMGKSITPDTLVSFGGEVKATRLPDGGVKLGGYLVRFGDATKTDLTGDFFTKNTDFGDAIESDGWFNHRMPVLFNGKRVEYVEPLPKVTMKKDDIGVFAEIVLGAHNEYEAMLADLGIKGALGWSSGTAPHLVDRKQVGNAYEITRWRLGLDASLTPTPAEPRNSVIPIKSLIPVTVADAETDKEIVTEPQEHNMSDILTDEVKTFITTAAEDAAKKAVNDLPEVKSAVSIVHDEADNLFTSLAEQAQAVKSYTVTSGQRNDPRLNRLTAWSKAALGANEGTPSEGGFMLEPTLAAEFLKPMHEQGAFTSAVRRLPVGNNSNYGWINGIDETSRASGSRWGGVLGYWLGEAGTKQATQPKFRRINWELKKIAVAMYATDELLADAAQFTAVANQSAGEEINFMVNDAVLNGDGVGKPLGLLGSGALIGVSRAATSAISHADILNMWQRMAPQYRANSAWFVNSEVETQLDALYFSTGATGILSPFVTYGQDGVMRVKGRPVYVTEFNPGLGTQGDILLANMNEYLFWEKGGVQSASSIHVQFLTDQTVFRFVYRCDGQSAHYSAVTPFKGSNTQSPFVSLLATT